MNARLLWTFVLLTGSVALAQVTTGTISGTVKDSTGAVLPGAKMVVLNEDTGISRTVQSDASGRYSAPALALGNYRVTASQEGFQTVVRSRIVLTLGREAVVDLSLPVGAVTQTVEVVGEAPLVESTSATLGSLVDDRTIRALPLNGRSYDQLALLQPGVTLFSPGGLQNSPFSAGSGKRFSVGGNRPRANSFLLDGTDINDAAGGTPGGAAGTNLGVDTIREFKIYTNSYSAEYGKSSGAIVSAVTRSGTNLLHGTAFEYLRNNVLDARNFFDAGLNPPPFKRNQFGGVIGGPIKRDKTFFFGGYEGLRQGLGTTLFATVPTVAARNGILSTGTVPVNPASVPFLNLYPLPNGRDFRDGTAEFRSSPTIVTNEDNFMVRVDHQINDKNSIFGRYTFDDDRYRAPQAIGNVVGINSSRRQYSTLQVNSVLNAKTLNSFRFAYNRSFQASDILPINPLGPEYSIIPGQIMGQVAVGAISGTVRTIDALGTGTANPSTFGLNLFQWADDFSYIAGRHALKTGVAISRIRDNTARTTFLRGSYTFTTFNDLLAGLPANLQAVPPPQNAYRGFRQSMYGIYVQDDFTVNSRLTLNLGLRWETATDLHEANGFESRLPSQQSKDMITGHGFFDIGEKNFQPRLGAAWKLNEGGKTVLRGGVGVYHNQLLPWAYSGPAATIHPFYTRISVTRPSFPNGYQQLTIGNLAPGSIRLGVFDPALKTPVTYQYTLSLQQQLSNTTMVQAAYVGSKTNHLVTQREFNTPNYTLLADGRKFFPLNAPRRNPNWASVSTITTDTNAKYNGVTLTLRRQTSSGLLYQATYTYQKNMDEISGLANAETLRSPQLLQDPENPRGDWGLSDFNSKQTFIFNFSYPLPFKTNSKAADFAISGWTVDGIGSFTAGLPFTVRLSTNNSRNGAANVAERPDLKPGKSNNPVLGGPDRYYDPNAFAFPLTGTYGNLGRNTVIGPGVANFDLSLEKQFKIREEKTVTFKAEVFNLFNHTNFDLPNTSVFTGTGTISGTAGRITATTTSSRQIQFALRLNF